MFITARHCTVTVPDYQAFLSLTLRKEPPPTSVGQLLALNVKRVCYISGREFQVGGTLI
jgi:hypothetical protein